MPGRSFAIVPTPNYSLPKTEGARVAVRGNHSARPMFVYLEHAHEKGNGLAPKPGKSRLDQFDWYRAIGGNPCVTERDDVLRLLKGISVDLGIRLSATAKLIRGRDIVLLGDFAVLPERTDIEPLSEPVVLYLGLDDDGGKIESMMLAAVELRPLVEAILDVARGGTSHKG